MLWYTIWLVILHSVFHFSLWVLQVLIQVSRRFIILPTIKYSYFYRLPRLWNALPPIDLSSSYFSIKQSLQSFFGDHSSIILTQTIYVRIIFSVHVTSASMQRATILPHLNFNFDVVMNSLRSLSYYHLHNIYYVLLYYC